MYAVSQTPVYAKPKSVKCVNVFQCYKHVRFTKQNFHFLFNIFTTRKRAVPQRQELTHKFEEVPPKKSLKKETNLTNKKIPEAICRQIKLLTNREVG